MDILTPEFIYGVINTYKDEDEDHSTLTNDSFGYLQFLLSPYIDAMKYIDTSDSLLTWIRGLFNRDNISDRILTTINTYEKKHKTNIDDTKQAILVGLLEGIFFEAEIAKEDNIITSWYIKSVLELENNKNIAKYLGVVTNDPYPDDQITVLPVTVSIGNNTFIHEMTENLVIGILVFYRSLGLNHPLSIFGSNFSDYDPIINSKIGEENDNDYTINVNNVIYKFDNDEIDFMKGLLTGALWNNIDPHKYITDLTEIKRKFIKPNGDIVKGLPNIGDKRIIERILLDY